MRLETLAAGLLVVLISPTAAAQQTTDRPGQIAGDDVEALSSCSDQPELNFGDVIQPVFSGRGSSLVHCVGGPAANVHNLD